MKRVLFLIFIIFSSYASAEMNSFGVDIPDDEDYSGYHPDPWFLAIYFFGGLWLMMNEKSPLHAFSNENPGIAACAFLFGVPIILGVLGIGY
jgi:hypothetical protein